MWGTRAAGWLPSIEAALPPTRPRVCSGVVRPIWRRQRQSSAARSASHSSCEQAGCSNKYSLGHRLSTIIQAVPPLGPLFDARSLVSTVANSRSGLRSRPAFVAAVRSLVAGYTYGECIDNASGLRASTNPFDPVLRISLLQFRRHHQFRLRFPDWLIPSTSTSPRLRLRSGWRMGLLQGHDFATGLPITMSNE